MGMSVLLNFITRHALSPSMHDSCPYLSYLDTCLARSLFSITNLENSRLQYPHLQPQCSFIVIILDQHLFRFSVNEKGADQHLFRLQKNERDADRRVGVGGVGVGFHDRQLVSTTDS